jgi:hypothetical protein
MELCKADFPRISGKTFFYGKCSEHFKTSLGMKQNEQPSRAARFVSHSVKIATLLTSCIVTHNKYKYVRLFFDKLISCIAAGGT